MKISGIGVKQKLLHRIGVAGVALATAAVMAVAGAPTASAANWSGPGGTGLLFVDNASDCQGHFGSCYGVLASWDVTLSIAGISVFYENETCVGPVYRQVDAGYLYPLPWDWGKKTVYPNNIEAYYDNPCYNVVS